jgi:hypothetical protein
MGHEQCMLVAGKQFLVAHVSTHRSLRNAWNLHVEQVFHAISLSHQALRRMGIARPRVRVCGLNPHAGESGLLASQDAEAIAPAGLWEKRSGILCDGPLPADTLFFAAPRRCLRSGCSHIPRPGTYTDKAPGFRRNSQCLSGNPDHSHFRGSWHCVRYRRDALCQCREHEVGPPSRGEDGRGYQADPCEQVTHRHSGLRFPAAAHALLLSSKSRSQGDEGREAGQRNTANLLRCPCCM